MLSRERRELRGGPPGARGDARSAGGPGADRDADPPWAPRDRALRTLDPADRGHSNVGGPRHSAGSSVHRAASRVRVGSAPRRPGDPRLADGGVRLRRARRYARPVGPALGQSAATITVGAAVAGSALALFALSDALWLSLALLFVTGFGVMVQLASSNARIHTIVPHDRRGGVMGLSTMALSELAPPGAP